MRTNGLVFWWHAIILVAMLLGAMPAGAVQPDEILDDTSLETRARAISAEVRCVVCQNEAIDTSNSGVARDLRLLIRERLTAGDTDEEVKNFLVARYGDFVLFRPPLRLDTALLWSTPFLLLLIGLFTVVRLVRRQRPADEDATAQLSADEEAVFETLDRKLTDRRQ